MKENQQLRCIALKLGVSGTATPIAQTRLYKDSYGFVKLQVYAPITQNTQSPICTAFCTTTDESGRVKISTGNYNLLYVGEFDLDGKGYSLFECYMPKEFTKVATAPDGLKITFNYYDTEAVVDEHGEVVLDNDGMPKRRATDLLVSSTYTTTVYQGGWNNEGVELNLSASEASQIVENMRNISAVQLDVLDIQDGMQTLANDLASEVERASGAETTLGEAIGKISKNLGELDNTVKQTGETIAQVREDAEETLEQVQNELEKTSQIVNDASVTVNDAKTAVEAISKDMSEYKEQVNEAISDLEGKISQGGSYVEVNGEVKAIVKFTEDPQEQLDSLKSIDEEQQEQLDSLKSIDEEQQEQLNSLKSIDEEQQEQLNSLKSIDEEQQEQLDSLKSIDEEQQEQLDSLKSIDEEQQEQLDSLKSIDEEQQEQIDGKVNKSGDTMTGDLTVPHVYTNSIRTNDYNYMEIKTNETVFGLKGANATIYNLAETLRTDPTKLTSTTENGWTLGDAGLILPSAGIYLVKASHYSITSQLYMTIMIYDGAKSARCILYDYMSSEHLTVSYSPSSTTHWSAMSLLDSTSVTIKGVAYKKLA